MGDTWDAWEMALDSVREIDQDRVLIAWTFSARSKHGAPAERREASILALRDGQIVRTESYASPEEALEAAGIEA
jgi:ketosteroid isomerase-like protein